MTATNEDIIRVADESTEMGSQVVTEDKDPSVDDIKEEIQTLRQELETSREQRKALNCDLSVSKQEVVTVRALSNNRRIRVDELSKTNDELKDRNKQSEVENQEMTRQMAANKSHLETKGSELQRRLNAAMEWFGKSVANTWPTTRSENKRQFNS